MNHEGEGKNDYTKDDDANEDEYGKRRMKMLMMKEKVGKRKKKK